MFVFDLPVCSDSEMLQRTVDGVWTVLDKTLLSEPDERA